MSTFKDLDRLTDRLAGSPSPRGTARTAAGPLGLLGAAGNRAVQRLLDDPLLRRPLRSPLHTGTPVQRVRVTKTGTMAHEGLVGGPAPGESGVPVGSVQVRTGEDIELAPGSTVPNVIALEYSGSLSADSRWLQFVWFELTASTPAGPVAAAGSIPTTSGTKPFTTNPATPSWTVDSASGSDPFYEAAAVAVRTASATTIFDAPGGGSVAPVAASVFASVPTATAATFTAHFETYLIQRDRAAYRVSYSAATSLTPSSTGGRPVASAIGYTVGASAPVAALPAARRAILLAGYPSFTRVQ